MKHTLLALFLLITLALPAGADSEKPFIAVFCQTNFQPEWTNFRPDLVYPTNDWNDIDDFASLVIEHAAGRPVIIDIDSHGTRKGYLAFDGNRVIDNRIASMGYVLNHLDQIPNIKYVTVEACFAGFVYHESCHNKYRKLNNRLDKVEPYVKETEPNYPVYGVSNVSNYGNAVFLQKLQNEDIEIHDLRAYHTYDPGMPTENKALENALSYFFRFTQLSQALSQVLTDN